MKKEDELSVSSTGAVDDAAPHAGIPVSKVAAVVIDLHNHHD